MTNKKRKISTLTLKQMEGNTIVYKEDKKNKEKAENIHTHAQTNEREKQLIIHAREVQCHRVFSYVLRE